MKSNYKSGDADGEYEVEPLFYEKYATQAEDVASASATLAIAIIGLCTCMYCLVKVLSHITMNSNQASNHSRLGRRGEGKDEGEGAVPHHIISPNSKSATPRHVDFLPSRPSNVHT